MFGCVVPPTATRGDRKMMEQPLVGPLLMLLLLGVVVRPVLQKKTARSSVTARASTQMRSINPTGGGPAKPARTSSPFNQQEWLVHHCGKQNQGSGEAVVRTCGCGKTWATARVSTTKKWCPQGATPTSIHFCQLFELQKTKNSNQVAVMNN